jgi:hypothetical protein
MEYFYEKQLLLFIQNRSQQALPGDRHSYRDRESKQEFLLEATMYNVLCMTGYVLSVDFWHNPWPPA